MAYLYLGGWRRASSFRPKAIEQSWILIIDSKLRVVSPHTRPRQTCNQLLSLFVQVVFGCWNCHIIA